MKRHIIIIALIVVIFTVLIWVGFGGQDNGNFAITNGYNPGAEKALDSGQETEDADVNGPEKSDEAADRDDEAEDPADEPEEAIGETGTEEMDNGQETEDADVNEPEESAEAADRDDEAEDPADEPEEAIGETGTEIEEEDLSTDDDKVRLLEKELEARGIESIDQEITDVIMSDDKVKYGFVTEEDTTNLLALTYNEVQDAFFIPAVQGYLKEELETALVRVGTGGEAIGADQLSVDVVQIVPGVFNVAISMDKVRQKFDNVGTDSILFLDTEVLITAHIVFYEGVGEEEMELIKDEVERLLEEKYPNHNIKLRTSIESA